jgi:hypothetical protein
MLIPWPEKVEHHPCASKYLEGQNDLEIMKGITVPDYWH